MIHMLLNPKEFRDRYLKRLPGPMNFEEMRAMSQEKHRNFPSLVDEFLEKSNKIPRSASRNLLVLRESTGGLGNEPGYKDHSLAEHRFPAAILVLYPAS